MTNFLLKIKISNIRQRGSILIYTMLVLIAITTISLAILGLFIPKFKIASESISSVVAISVADSVMEWCLFSNRDDPVNLPTVPPQPIFSISTANLPITYQIYRGGAVSTCLSGETPLDYRTVGNYRGISRSLEIQ
jgi:Tfp pilus assembly protein PilX